MSEAASAPTEPGDPDYQIDPEDDEAAEKVTVALRRIYGLIQKRRSPEATSRLKTALQANTAGATHLELRDNIYYLLEQLVYAVGIESDVVARVAEDNEKMWDEMERIDRKMDYLQAGQVAALGLRLAALCIERVQDQEIRQYSATILSSLGAVWSAPTTPTETKSEPLAPETPPTQAHAASGDVEISTSTTAAITG